MADNIAQGELLLINHEVNANPIPQRATDGYVNATAMCQAAGKRWNNYSRNPDTKEFVNELSANTQISATELIQVVRGGYPELQGTWVHPQVAINLAQWLSPSFAVKVSQWVFEWMSGGGPKASHLPDHIRRYLVNRKKIPHTHFSMLDQMTLKLLASLEEHGYILPDTMMPDIALGRMFSRWLRENGHNTDGFMTYEHEFIDNVRPTVPARAYPNELMTAFNLQLDAWIRDGRALKYFGDRDPNSILPLKQVFAELPAPEKNADELSGFDQSLKKAISYISKL